MLNKILQAKDQRQLIRRKIAENGYATISINFNIPGYPKTDALFSKVFTQVCKELTDYLKANRILFKEHQVQMVCDEAGDICFFPLVDKGVDYIALKKQLEIFEETHPLGRILDVDLFNKAQKAISSHKQKSCFICKKKSALHCMREQNHSYEELRQYIYKKFVKYWKKTQEEHLCKQLSAMATWSILTEVSLLNKPGLVSPDGNGSHTDMNYHTFLASTASISTYFYEVAQMGFRWKGKKKNETLIKLRCLGLEMERDMFAATQEINTQKGIVFLMVFSLFTTAYVFKEHEEFSVDKFRKTLQKMAKGLVDKELSVSKKNNLSHGEQCFKTFGKKLAGGIRQEVEEGLPIFFEAVYPFMKQIGFSYTDTSNKPYFENQCKRILIKIMSVNNDTNILFRSDASTLKQVREKALNILTEELNLDKSESYQELIDFCRQKNISPGGSADLLAISLFLYRAISLRF